MGVIETIKDVVSTLQQIDNLDLHKQIQKLQKEIQDLVDENAALRKRVREAQDLLAVHQQLAFHDNAYWQAVEDGEEHGPFCSNCWDGRRKLIRMHTSDDPDYALCPKCRTEVNLTGHYETVEGIPPSL